MFLNTIFISDIGGKQETVLPYVLNFTKHISNKISVIHVVDPQKQPAVSSAYADSQSFEVGNKLSHQEIIDREKHNADLILKRHLSKEASKLNYPLRVKTIVESDSLKNKLSEELGNNDEQSLIIISASFEGTILDDLDEFLETTKSYNTITLIVPPGHEFSVPEKACVLYDFDSNIHNGVFNVINALEAFIRAQVYLCNTITLHCALAKVAIFFNFSQEKGGQNIFFYILQIFSVILWLSLHACIGQVERSSSAQKGS